MTTITCGWCRARCHMERCSGVNLTDFAGNPVSIGNAFSVTNTFMADAAFICDGCHRMSVATWQTSRDPRELWSDDFEGAEDSEEVLNLMAEVLNEVWQAPARSKRVAEARKAKRSQPKTSGPRS